MNNNLRLTDYNPTRTSKNLINSFDSKRKIIGINIFYNTKLNAISGLSNNMVFSCKWDVLKAFLLKRRENSIKYFVDFQAYAFQNLVVIKRKTNIFLKNNNSYKGIRLDLNLPIRGQRTHTNSKTARKLNKL